MEEVLQQEKNGYRFKVVGDMIFFTVTDETESTEEQRIERTAAMYGDMIEIYAMHQNQRYKILYDIRAMHNESTNVPAPMRKQYAAILNHPQTIKVATVGNSNQQSGPAKFILWLVRVLKTYNIGWFEDVEEAKVWLNT